MRYPCFSIIVHLYLFGSALGWLSVRFKLPFIRPKLRNLATQPLDWSTANQASMNDEDKKLAFEMLDYITCPVNRDDPDYDFQKDMKRDELLASTTYSGLKIALHKRELDTSGDKLEMISRILLHIIDPSIKYQQLTGMEPRLSGVTEEDYASGKVRRATEKERAAIQADVIGTSDADDLRVLRTPGPNSDFAAPDRPQRRFVMDGLSRKEASFHTVRVQRTETEARKTDLIHTQQSPDPFFPQTHPSFPSSDAPATKDRMIGAYVVSNKMVLRNWADARYAVIVLPSGTDHWRDKDLRVLADQLAFQTHAVVIVPDLYRGQTYVSEGPSETTEDVENTLQRPRGETFSAKDEWSRHQDPKRVFDDLMATLAYVRAQHNVQSVALLGMGEGAGTALESACDLSDLARVGIYNAIENKLLQCGAIPPLVKNSEETPFAAVHMAIAAGLEAQKGPAFDILQSVVKANLHVFTRRPQALRMSDRVHAEHEKHERTALQRELASAEEEFDLDAALEAAAKKRSEDDARENSAHRVSDDVSEGATEVQPIGAAKQTKDPSVVLPELSETETYKKLDELYDLITPKPNPAHADKGLQETGVDLESLAGKPPSEVEIEEVLRRVHLSQLVQTAQGAPPAANTPASESPSSNVLSTASIPARKSDVHEKSPAEAAKAAQTDDAAIQAIEDATSFHEGEDLYAEQDTTDPVHLAARAGLRKELDLDLLRSEWSQTFQAAQRAEKRNLLAPFASYTAEEFANFVPRSVVAVSPQGYNASRVGNELCISPLFLFGGDDPESANHTVPVVAQVQDLYNHLSNRKDEVMDYCFRVYEKAHPAFIHKTQRDHEARCSQVAVSHAAGWVSAFAHLNEHSCVAGLGQAKNTEECLKEVSHEEMSEVELFTPTLASYLHDDPTYFRNNE